MAADDPHFRLRIPVELRDRVAAEAKASGRSINAEIVARLEQSFRDVRAEARIEFATERLEAMIDIFERNGLLDQHPELAARRRDRQR